MLRRMLLFVFGHDTPDDPLCLLCGLVGKRKRRVVGKPNIDIGPVLNVLRKKLAPKSCREETSEHKKTERERKHGPAKTDRSLRRFVIGAVEALLATLGNRGFLLLRRAKQIVAE